MLAHFLGQRFSHTEHAEFRSTVGTGTFCAINSRHRGDIDDVTAIFLDQLRQYCARNLIHPHQINIDHLFPLGWIDFQERAKCTDSCIIDQYIRWTELFGQFPHSLIDLLHV